MCRELWTPSQRIGQDIQILQFKGLSVGQQIQSTCPLSRQCGREFLGYAWTKWLRDLCIDHTLAATRSVHLCRYSCLAKGSAGRNTGYFKYMSRYSKRRRRVWDYAWYTDIRGRSALSLTLTSTVIFTIRQAMSRHLDKQLLGKYLVAIHRVLSSPS